MPRTEDVLEAFVAEAPGPIRRVRRTPNSCVLATRIAVAALGELGVFARPLSVTLAAFNGPMMRRVAERGWPADRAAMIRWGEEVGAWSVAIGEADEPPRGPGLWNGHLVAWVEGRYLVDASLDQVRRPERQMEAPTVWGGRPPEGFATGEAPWLAVVGGGALGLLYRAHPGRESWREAPDWHAPGRHQPATRQIVAALRRRTGRAG